MTKYHDALAGTALERREILRLLSIGGVAFASALAGCADRLVSPKAPARGDLPRSGARTPRAAGRDFLFLQLSDTHWGFSGPPDPEASTTLRDTIALINASPIQPDFVMFTGDLTHTTPDAGERRKRMNEVKAIIAELSVGQVRFIPGEHDASLDAGAAYREVFGETHYSFDHEGVHFVALDNVSDPAALLGDAQIAWLESDLAKLDPEVPVVVFAHRPLFDLYPQWDWMTLDGAKAIEVLQRRKYVTVFYGHIHQEHHHTTGNIEHHAARSLVFPLPAPGSVPKKAPLPWDPASSDHGLGYRAITAHDRSLGVEERPFRKA